MKSPLEESERHNSEPIHHVFEGTMYLTPSVAKLDRICLLQKTVWNSASR